MGIAGKSGERIAEVTKFQILFSLYRRLQRGSCTIEILRQWRRLNGYTFSDRTLYRYLAELSNALDVSEETLELYSGEKNKQYWKLVRYRLQDTVTLFDINSFYLFKHFMPPGVFAYRTPSFEKLEKIIYGQFANSKFERVSEAGELCYMHTDFGGIMYTEHGHLQIEEITWAIENSREIVEEPQVLSTRNGDATELVKGDRLCPLKLAFHAGQIHLIVWNTRLKKIAVMPISNSSRFSLTNQSFNRKNYHQQLGQYFLNHFGLMENIDEHIYNIELVLDNKVATLINDFFWHSTQKIEPLENGKWRLTFQCGINHELVKFVLSYGNQVTVSAPVQLLKIVEMFKQPYPNEIAFTKRASLIRKNL